jgi:two-component system chemotaxis sensor kinase CheA
MVGLRGLNSKLERVIRDTSIQTRKKINFSFEGLDQELDKTIVDQLSDPLIHMVRNSVDHGIESVDERINLGKSEVGTIKITARREGGTFVIHIQDDGKGLSREKIFQKAKEKKIISGDENLSDPEVFELIFENGFSTKESASEISGRGVGMNVVKEMILSMKGSYEIESELNVGTIFKIKLPLSLSLFNGVIVESGNERYIIPSSQINEIIDSREVSLVRIDGQGSCKEVLQIKDEVIETRALLELLHKKNKEKNCESAVYIVTSFSNKRFALRVDRLLSIQKIAQKPLSPEMRISPGASGITILGDGKPVIILDLNLLLKGKGKV